MSDTPQTPEWWQASDGKWYPPESKPPSLAKPPPAGPPAAGPGLGPPQGMGPPPAPGYGPMGAGPGYGGPGYPQQGYGQAGYGMPYAPRRQTEPLAVASLIVACAAIPLACFCGLALFGAPVAVVLGFMGRKKIKESGGQLDGDGLAIAGMIVGGVGCALLLAWSGFLVFWGGSLFFYGGGSG